MSAPETIGERRITAFLGDHATHWLFVGSSVGGPYVGCNPCCRVTTPGDWPARERVDDALLLEAIAILRLHNKTPTGLTRKCLPGCVPSSAAAAG